MHLSRHSTPSQSAITFHFPEGTVFLRISGRYRANTRRTVLLAIFKQIKPLFKDWTNGKLENFDWTETPQTIYERGIHSTRAVDLKTHHGQFGAWVRIERQRQFLTQAKLSNMAGISTTSLSFIERGYQKPKLTTIQNIRSALKDQTLNSQLKKT